MALKANEIEALLMEGLAISSSQREFTAKLDSSENVRFTDIERLARVSLPLQYILDEAQANESGSKLNDESQLRRMLGEIAVKAM